MPQVDDMIKVAEILEDVPLSAKDLHIFCSVPMRFGHLGAYAFLQEWAIKVVNDSLVTLNIDVNQFENATTLGDINDTENLYNILSSYHYLSYRFPQFVEGEKCTLWLQQCAQMIQNGFDTVTIANKHMWIKDFDIGS